MITSLTRRHVHIFVRDRGALFFSLLSPLILFVLYFFFLSSTQIASLQEQLPNSDAKTIELFLNSWVYAGIVMTTAVTTGLAALGVFVNDRESGRFTDLAVSPVARWKVVASYLLATASIAAVITTAVYIAAQIHLIVLGAPLLNWETLLRSVGSYMLVALSFAAISSLAVTLIRSSAAFTSLSIITGTSIGFLAGIYVPIGVLSSTVATILNGLPFAQAATLIREPFVATSLAELAASQPSVMVDEIKETYGLIVTIGDHTLTMPIIIIILIAIGISALIGAVWQVSRKLK